MKNRKLNRLSGFDYSSDCLYFVTSVVRDRIPYFGEIENGEMRLNPIGEIAEKQWEWLGNQYPYIKLHSFVVMPNHIHGIIEIDRNVAGTGRENETNAIPDAGTGHDLSLRDKRNQRDHPETKIKSLSEIIGAYKTTVSKQIHLAGYPEFAWQRSFHDHIIRDEQSYFNICNYILNNPLNWTEDKLNNP